MNSAPFTKDDILETYSNHIPTDKKDHLYAYAIIRSDLDMPAGKLSSQAGHAYTDTLNQCLESKPERYHNYRNPTKGGSKVTLKAKNENQIINAFNKAIELGLPCAIIVDREHILPPHFNGEPIITALGIGPCTKDEARAVVKKFQCL